MNSLDNKIFSHIQGYGRGKVFTPKHLSRFGDARTVGMSLTRLCRKGKIRRLARGLYDYPRKHDKLGLLAPTVDAVAKALAGRDAIRLQPSGAYAANLLGISDQVPMKIVFLTDGAERKVKLDNREIILKRTTPRNMATAGRISGLVIQALRYIGKVNFDEKIIDKLEKRLDTDQKKQLMNDLQYAPDWIATIIRKINSVDPN